MKNYIPLFALVVILAGCASTPSGKVTQAEGVVIPAVNAAMTTWSAYVSSGKATQQEINTVQTAYNAYYTAQLGAEAALIAPIATGSTNTLDAAAENTAVTNAETQLINLISQYAK